MTQTTNRIFDDFAKLMTDAAGAAEGMKQEAQNLFKSQSERFLRDMDVVTREDFEIVKAMAQKAREENEALSKRIGCARSPHCQSRGRLTPLHIAIPEMRALNWSSGSLVRSVVRFRPSSAADWPIAAMLGRFHSSTPDCRFSP